MKPFLLVHQMAEEIRCVSGLHGLLKIGPCIACQQARRTIWNSKDPIAAQAAYNLEFSVELAVAAKFCIERDRLAVEAGLAQIAETDRINAERAQVKQQENMSRRRAMSNNARAIKMRAKGELSVTLLDRLYKLQKGKCPCCKAPLGKSFHMDHITPLSRGGTNTDSNIQLLRSRCNISKNAMDPIIFMQMNGFLI